MKLNISTIIQKDRNADFKSYEFINFYVLAKIKCMINQNIEILREEEKFLNLC
jgi:hypothetical protein